MSAFKVQEAFNGSAVKFGPNYPSVEIVFDPANMTEHGHAYVLASPLASEREINEQVDQLISDLEMVRGLAVQKLRGYADRARTK